MNIDKTQNPKFLNDYLMYISVTKGLSPRTVNEYYFDIRLFLRYLVMMDKGLEDSKVLEELSIKDITIERINQVKLEDFYNYLYYIQRERDNNARARGRKVSALKSLFKYLYKNVGLIDQNPADNFLFRKNLCQNICSLMNVKNCLTHLTDTHRQEIIA